MGLHDHGLTRDERARCVAGVNRGDAKAAHPVHERIEGVVAVDGAQLGLERRGLFQLLLVLRLIQETRKPDHRMRVDQSRSDDFRANTRYPSGIFTARACRPIRFSVPFTSTTPLRIGSPIIV